jgi:CRP-like cAMP-binding protein
MPAGNEDRDADARFEALIERSSLGTAGARRIRGRVPDAEARAIGQLADMLDESWRPSAVTSQGPTQPQTELPASVSYDRDDRGGAHDVADRVREHLTAALTLLTGSPEVDAEYGRLRPGRRAVVNFWDALTPAERDSFRDRTIHRMFDAGAALMHEGDRADRVMMIVGGRVQVSVDYGGRRVIVERGPGDLVGERSALRVSEPSATVIALESVSALVVEDDAFVDFLRGHPRLLAILESQTRSDLDDTGTDTTALAGGSPEPALWPLRGQNCTVVLTDVMGFSARYRTERARQIIRQAAQAMMQSALGSPWQTWREDRGDGQLVIVSPAIPTAQVIERLLTVLPHELKRHNRVHRDPLRIQLRVAVNVGPVVQDEHGVDGRSIINAARMLEARAFRQAIASQDAVLGIITSTFVYDVVIQPQDSGKIDPRAFLQIQASVKGFRFPAWMQIIAEPVPHRALGAAGA